MKMFVIGVAAAIVVALAAGFTLNAVQVGSDRFNSTEDVRL